MGSCSRGCGVKLELTNHSSTCNPEAITKISADASYHRLGAVLLQEVGRDCKPVAYASHSMSETEKRYAQIEKEALPQHGHVRSFRTTSQAKAYTLKQTTSPLYYSSGQSIFPLASFASIYASTGLNTPSSMYRVKSFIQLTLSLEHQLVCHAQAVTLTFES